MSGPDAILVGSSSATHGRSWEIEAHHIQAIDRNHSEMVKFQSNDAIYDRVLTILKRFTRASSNMLMPRKLSPKEGIKQQGFYIFVLNMHIQCLKSMLTLDLLKLNSKQKCIDGYHHQIHQKTIDEHVSSANQTLVSGLRIAQYSPKGRLLLDPFCGSMAFVRIILAVLL